MFALVRLGLYARAQDDVFMFQARGDSDQSVTKLAVVEIGHMASGVDVDEKS